jgi:hypothetical protein
LPDAIDRQSGDVDLAVRALCIMMRWQRHFYFVVDREPRVERQPPKRKAAASIFRHRAAAGLMSAADRVAPGARLIEKTFGSIEAVLPPPAASSTQSAPHHCGGLVSVQPYWASEMRPVPGRCNQIQTLPREAEPQPLILRVDGVTRALEIITRLALQFIHLLRGHGYLHKFEFARIVYPGAASASA